MFYLKTLALVSNQQRTANRPTIVVVVLFEDKKVGREEAYLDPPPHILELKERRPINFTIKK